VGLQGSGKSTFYRERFATSHVLISKDLLGHNRHKQHRQMQLIADALHAGHSIVVDNTNATVADRAPLIEIGRAHAARIAAYAFQATVAEARARNQQREGRARVPDVAIFATAKHFEQPTYAESFDQIFTVRIIQDDGFAVIPVVRDACERGDADAPD